jgi:hypothetical protein
MTKYNKILLFIPVFKEMSPAGNNKCLFTVVRSIKFLAQREDLLFLQGFYFCPVFLCDFSHYRNFYSIIGYFVFEEPLKAGTDGRISTDLEIFSDAGDDRIHNYYGREQEIMAIDRFSFYSSHWRGNYVEST